MEYLHNGFTMDIPAGAFPLSTDSILLADFVRLPKNANVLDLGAGPGTLGLLLCAKDGNCHVTGIELDPIAHAAAQENILRNALQSRMESICTDLRSFSERQYDLILSNPPYYSGGPASRQTPQARREDFCTLEDVFRSASANVKFGGDFYIVHKPERLSELCVLASRYSLEPKRLRLVHHTAGDNITLVLLACRKGAKPGLIIDEVDLHHTDGTPTPFYAKLYHL